MKPILKLSWRRQFLCPAVAGLLLAFPAFFPLRGAPYHDPQDQGQPGDPMIQQYLAAQTSQIEGDVFTEIHSAEQWNQLRPQFLREYYEMLGLWPMPEKTPLRATVTRTLDRGEYSVEMLAYESRPGLYVTGNLYRPARLVSGPKYPAILYVCGHSGRGRNGNKVAFQSHGIWFARHGYLCLIVDTLQLGEISGIHHGTYREGRWWWLSRGYTPAGVECWNGIRGIDYLLSRPEVDPDRIGVTGISGGGAATFWIAAADERVKAAVAVSGMADLESYISHRVINGHCDCMFLYNAYQWPWTRVAALIAPRPLLFVNSDHDDIFPMDANERIINRLERVYSWFGAGDDVDSFVSMGGHNYRKDIRQAAFRFMNSRLKNDPQPVRDSEIDLVTGPREEIYPIPPEELRVFPTDADIPADAINKTVDQIFVPMAKVELPKAEPFEAWKGKLITDLRRLAFHHFQDPIPAARKIDSLPSSVIRLETEPGIFVRLRAARAPQKSGRVFLLAASSDFDGLPPSWLLQSIRVHDGIYICEPRGFGSSQWTQKNPPNYVERSHYLLGRTVDSGRVWDLAATASWLRESNAPGTEVYLAGEGAAAVLAVYAALLNRNLAGVILENPPASHMDPQAPVLLNVLRVCDIPDAIGLLAPRQVEIFQRHAPPARFAKTRQIFEVAGAADRLANISEKEK